MSVTSDPTTETTDPIEATEAAGVAETEHSAYQLAVDNHRTRYREALEHGDFYAHGFDNDPVFERVGASKVRTFVRRHSVAGWTGVTLAVAMSAVGFYLDSQAGHPRTSPYGASGIGCGIATWIAACILGHRYTRRTYIALDGVTCTVSSTVDEATNEIRAAVKRGHATAPELLDAAESLRPGLEELIEERVTLHDAIAQGSRYSYRLDYVAALEERLADVDLVLIDICAELTAAAGLLFASRPDLLVRLPQAPTSSVPVLPVTKITQDTQRALAESRKVLAAVAERLV